MTWCRDYLKAKFKLIYTLIFQIVPHSKHRGFQLHRSRYSRGIWEQWRVQQ